MAQNGQNGQNDQLWAKILLKKFLNLKKSLWQFEDLGWIFHLHGRTHLCNTSVAQNKRVFRTKSTGVPLTRRAEAGILRCRELVRSADQICFTFVFFRLLLYFWVSMYADSHFWLKFRDFDWRNARIREKRLTFLTFSDFKKLLNLKVWQTRIPEN